MSKKIDTSSTDVSSKSGPPEIIGRAVTVIGEEIDGDALLVIVEDTEPEVEAPEGDAATPKAVKRRKIVITDSIDFGDELEDARSIQDEAIPVIKDFMSQASNGSIDDVDAAKAIVEKVVSSIFRNQDSMLSLIRVKNEEQYTIGHSLNVAVMAIAIGRQMGFSKEKVKLLGLSAIFHDVGRVLVPEALLKKSGPLTDEEFSAVKKHTSLGSELLGKCSALPEEVAKVAAEHHERYDARGYELGLEGRDIALFARVVAIADVYDAATTNLPYGETLKQADAVKFIYDRGGKQFDKRILEKFLKCLGVYPIGSFVRLSTGQAALVRGQNRSNLLRPKVLVLFDKEGLRYHRTFDFDLLQEEDKHVVSAIDSSEFKVNVDEYLV